MIHQRALWIYFKQVWDLAHTGPARWTPLQKLRARLAIMSSPAFRAYMGRIDFRERTWAWRHRRKGNQATRWDTLILHLHGADWLSKVALLADFGAFVLDGIDRSCVELGLPGRYDLGHLRSPQLLTLEYNPVCNA